METCLLQKTSFERNKSCLFLLRYELNLQETISVDWISYDLEEIKHPMHIVHLQQYFTDDLLLT